MPCPPKEVTIAVRLEDVGDTHPMIQLLKLPRRDNKRHAVEALLQFVLVESASSSMKSSPSSSSSSLVLHFRHDREVIRMLRLKSKSMGRFRSHERSRALRESQPRAR
ncbi:MAG: hypothetical protein MZV63_36255 [Marinilabiliales bacterium]|nr:hypothetical protein [Marinilabiliales bacterium]